MASAMFGFVPNSGSAAASAAAAGSVVAVKIVADGQIRRFTLPNSSVGAAFQYAALLQLVKDNYAKQHAAGHVLKFEDDERDLCLVSNADELTEAMRLLADPKQALKLFLVAPSPAPAAAAAAAAASASPKEEKKTPPAPTKEAPKSAPAPLPVPPKPASPAASAAAAAAAAPAPRPSASVAAAVTPKPNAPAPTPAPKPNAPAPAPAATPAAAPKPAEKPKAAPAPAPEKELPVTTADGKEIHYRISCDGCGMSPLVGIRYKCSVCPVSYDLCEACEKKSPSPHSADHAFLKIKQSVFGPRAEQKAKAPTVHVGITCDGCNTSPITGVRYKCTVCNDFDLCEKCEAKGSHPADHVLIKAKAQLNPRPAFGGRFGFGGHCGRGGFGGGHCGRGGGFFRHMAAAASRAANGDNADLKNVAGEVARRVSAAVAACPWLKDKIEGVEVRSGPAPATSDAGSVAADFNPNAPFNVRTFLDAVAPQIAAKAAALNKQAEAKASASSSSSSSSSKDSKDEKKAAPAVNPAGQPNKARLDRELESVRALGFGTDAVSDDTLRALLAAARARTKGKRKQLGNVQYVVEQLLQAQK